MSRVQDPFRMAAANDAAYPKRLAAKLLGEANDLKRTPDALADELGWDRDLVQRIMAGTADVEEARSLLIDMASSYPVSLNDLWVEPDDTDQGVRVMRADASAATSRIFDRSDRSGGTSPYYEYRDTAMSSLAPFKPEWIKELRHVTDDDPENADVAYNNGHLMHQLTFFIGEVNFYWVAGGKKHCRRMNTGDSCYITPYVPHSFTKRSADGFGLIIAITYGGAVRYALDSLSYLDTKLVDAMAGDLRDADDAYRARLARFMAGKSLCREDLAERLADAGIDHARAARLVAGACRPAGSEVEALAAAVGVRPAELTVAAFDEHEEVVVRHRSQAAQRAFPRTNAPAYRFAELAGTPHQPGLCGLDVEIVKGSPEAGGFEHSLHEYIYNYGGDEITLHWGEGGSETLRPDDSAYVRPGVRHWLSGPAGARAVVARVPGRATNDVFDEYAAFDTAGRRRAMGETMKWF